MDYYNLYVILFVGYRVNSKRGTAFRIWASAQISAEAATVAEEVSLDYCFSSKPASECRFFQIRFNRT
jgi:hypothetical protein